MVGALALVLVVTAAFSAGVVVLRSRRTPADRVGQGWDREQIQGFVFVGALALAVLGVGVVLVGWVARQPGVAEAMAVLGLMAYLLYLGIATVMISRTARRLRPRRAHEGRDA